MIKAILYFIIISLSSPILATPSVSDNEITASLFGYSASLNLNLIDHESTFTETPTNLAKVTVNNVTIASFESSFNCKTGAINISGGIPDISNFSDAMKIFAPFAVDENGDVDFASVLKDLITEFAIQEVTEKTLDFIAYIHYLVTSSMNEKTKPADLKAFQSEAFSSCIKSKTANAVEFDWGFGMGIASAELADVKAGLDVTSLLGLQECFDNLGFKFDDDEATKRYEKSKAIVRALFNNLLNANFDFSFQEPEICQEFDNYISPLSAVKGDIKDRLKLSKQGQLFSFDGSSTIVAGGSNGKLITARPQPQEVVESKSGGLATDADLNIEVILEVTPSTAAQSSQNALMNKTAMQTGSNLQDVHHDFSTKIIYIPKTSLIDAVDLDPLERITFYDNTFNDFFRSISSEEEFKELSVKIRTSSRNAIKKILTLQQINPKVLKMFECARNTIFCTQAHDWITRMEYKRFVEYAGRTTKCRDATENSNHQECTETIPIDGMMIKNPVKESNGNITFEQLEPATDIQKREYLYKKLQSKIRSLLELYIRSTSAIVVDEEDQSNDNDKKLSDMEYLLKKIEYLKLASLLNEYWTSPIDALEPLHISTLSNIRDNSPTGYTNNKTALNIVISEILLNGDNSTFTAKDTNTIINRISFTPIIYEPVNELQLSKLLYYYNNSLRLAKLLSDPESTAMGMTMDDFNWIHNLNQSMPLIPTPATQVFDSVDLKLGGVIQSVPGFIYNTKIKSLYTYNGAELKMITDILVKFKNFYIKRLLDIYTQKYKIVTDYQYQNIIRENTSIPSLRFSEYELKKASFRMQQRREMITLLLD